MNDKQKRQYEARIWELREALAVVADRLFTTNHFIDCMPSPFDAVVENNTNALAEAKTAGWISTFRPEVKCQYEQRIKELEGQRDELLAALQGILEKFGSTVMPGESGADAVEAAVIAIHKAEGKVE